MELISRRGALQAIARLKSDYDCDYNTIVEKCRDAVKRLPTHGEERKTGKWKIITDFYPHNVYCSVCHKRYAQTHWDVWNDKDFPLPRNYCPNCGAKMEVDE